MVHVPTSKCFNFTMLTIFLLSNAIVEAQNNDKRCNGNISQFATACEKSISRVLPGPPRNPSKECCDQVQNADIVPCICSHVTKDFEKFVDVKRLVNVAKYCQRPVKRGSKCGSYTVPSEA